MKKLPALLNTPARAAIAVGLIILIAEFLIMALFEVIHGDFHTRDDSQLVMIFNYLDPILLIAIVAPTLYILIFWPMRNQQDELEVAHRKIERAHREWMAALDVIDDPVFLHDKAFRILRCNKAYQQRAGIPLPEIIGQPYYEVFPKNHAPMPCCLRAMEEAEEAEEEVLASGASYRSRAFSVHDEQGAYLYSVHTLEDITERKHQEERTAALLELSTSIETLDEKTLLQRGLDTVQHLTDSRIGFLHFVSEDQNEIELVTWSTDTLAHYCHAAFDRHYPLSAAGIWVDSVLLKQPVIINDYATAPGKKGLPEGHAAVQRFICVPVLEGTQVRMIVGVGNAARNYDEHDVETLKLFSYDLYRIAQHKRAIKSLEESAQHFRAIAQSANDAIISADSTGEVVGWNAAAERLFGYAEAEITGQLLTVLMPERFRNLHKEGLARVVAGGAPHVIGKTAELAGLRKDGSEFPLEISLAQWQIADGQFFTAIIRDITERKLADITLQKSRYLLQSVMENVPACIFWKDRDSRYLGCNTNFAKGAGYFSPDEVADKTDFEMGWKDQAESYRADDKAVMESGSAKLNYEELFTTPDGDLAWARTSKVPLRDESNQVIGVLGIYDDITARKAAEAALRESETRLSTIFRASPIGIAITRLADSMVIDANPKILDVLGYTREEVVGSTTLGSHVWADPEHRNRMLKLLKEQGRLQNLEAEFRTKSGELRYFSVSAELIDLAGEQCGLTLLHDITEHKQAEAALQESEEKFRAIFKEAKDGIILTDAETGLIADCNAEFERQCGRPLAQLKTLHPWDLMPPELQEAAHSKFGVVKATGRGHMESGFQRPDGTFIPTEVVATRVRLGDRDYLISISRDITERKRVEESLNAQFAETRRARLEWQAVFDSIGHLIFLHDSEFRVIRANRAYIEQAGKPLEEIIGQPYYAIFPQSATPMPCCLRAMEKAAEEEEVAFGKTIYRSRTFAVRDEQGEYRYSAHILEDITERKQAEAQLAEQLEELRRWHVATSGREGRILELKHEINELLVQAGQPPRYPSAET